MEDFLIVLITVPSEEEGAKIAHALVEGSLAACVNIVRNIRSIYKWQGKVEDEGEFLLIAKTRRTLFEELEKKVKELHSYAVPEVIAIPIAGGSREYLGWLADSTA